MYLFMDCVTTRLQMKIGMFFSLLDPEKCKKLGKIGEILFGGARTEKNLGKMTIKGCQKFKNFPKKMWKYFLWSANRDEFVKWSASQKRLRTAEVGHQNSCK